MLQSLLVYALAETTPCSIFLTEQAYVYVCLLLVFFIDSRKQGTLDYLVRRSEVGDSKKLRIDVFCIIR